MSYLRNVTVVQTVQEDANNTSLTNLTAANGHAFTGTKTSTLGVNSIQVMLKTDKNCTLRVEQSSDGDNWDVSDAFQYYSSIDNFGTTVQAVGAWVRVTVVVDDATDTTYFRLTTVLCPIADPLPRALNEVGNLKVAIYGNEDGYGFECENTPTGEERAVSPVKLVGGNFDGSGTPDSNFWTVPAVVDSATVTVGNAQVVLKTTTGTTSACKLHSVRRARYVAGASMCYRSVVQLTAGVANNTRTWGICYGATMPTITDGAYFQLSGSTFSVVTVKSGGTPSVVTSFNGALGANWTPGTTVHTYEIYWTNSKVYFVVGDEILHEVSASAATWCDTMHHYIYFSNTNSGSVGSSTPELQVRVASIRRLGPLLAQPTAKYLSGTGTTTCKIGPGNLHGLLISGIVNGSIVTLYDQTTAASPTLWASGALGVANNDNRPLFIDFKGIPFFTGLSLGITTQNCNVLVIYD